MVCEMEIIMSPLVCMISNNTYKMSSIKLSSIHSIHFSIYDPFHKMILSVKGIFAMFRLIT